MDRLCLTILLLSVVSGVYGASVAVDVLNPLAAIDNVTLSDNSTKALNVSDSSALKIRDDDVQLRVIIPQFYIFISSLVLMLYYFIGTGADVSMYLYNKCD